MSDRQAFSRENLIATIIEVGMMRRDVATDVADAILARWPMVSRDVLKWVGEVYPATTRDGAACVDMTWGEWAALRAALGLHPQPPRKYRR